VFTNFPFSFPLGTEVQAFNNEMLGTCLCVVNGLCAYPATAACLRTGMDRALSDVGTPRVLGGPLVHPLRELPFRYGFSDHFAMAQAFEWCSGHCFSPSTGADAWNTHSGSQNAQWVPTPAEGIFDYLGCMIPESARTTLHTYTQPECHNEPAIKFLPSYGPALGPVMTCPNLFDLGDCNPPVEDGCHLGREHDGTLSDIALDFIPGSSLFSVLDPSTMSHSMDGDAGVLTYTTKPYYTPFLSAAVALPEDATDVEEVVPVFGSPSYIEFSAQGVTGTSVPINVTITYRSTQDFYFAKAATFCCVNPVDQYFLPSDSVATATLFVKTVTINPCMCQIPISPSGDAGSEANFYIDLDMYDEDPKDRQKVTEDPVYADHCLFFSPCPCIWCWPGISIGIVLLILAIILAYCFCGKVDLKFERIPSSDRSV